MGVNFPVTQGFIPSFQSAVIDVAGSKVLGVKSITWDESCEGEVEYGNGPLPVGITVGQYMGNCEIEQLITEYNVILAKMGGNFRAKAFNLGVQFSEVGSPTISVDFFSLRISGQGGSFTGKAGTVIKYKCQLFVPIEIDGRSMIKRLSSTNGTAFSVGASASFGGVSAGGGLIASAGAGISIG